MLCKRTQHTKQFKLYTVNYQKKHPNPTQIEYSKNLQIVFFLIKKFLLTNNERKEAKKENQDYL